MSAIFSKLNDSAEHKNIAKVKNQSVDKTSKSLCNTTLNSLNARELRDNSTAKWHRLVPFGQYAHYKGLQVVNNESACAMVNYFNSLRGRLMRKFLGLPIYVGHPDDCEWGDVGNKTIYGRVKSLKINGEALWGLLHWTKLGQKLFSGGFLRYLSPRWMMRKVGDRIFQPIRLISIGMTNHPNLHGEGGVISIESSEGSQPIQGMENVDGAHGEDKIKSVSLPNFIESNVSCNTTYAKKPDYQSGEDEVCAESGPVPGDGSSITNLDGRGKNGSGLHIDSLTENLSRRSNGQSRGDQILALVHEQMINFGDDYQSAWSAVKRRFPTLFRENF